MTLVPCPCYSFDPAPVAIRVILTWLVTFAGNTFLRTHKTLMDLWNGGDQVSINLGWGAPWERVAFSAFPEGAL